MRVFCTILLLELLFFGAFFGSLSFTSAQNVYAVDLQGFAWDHSSLSALLVTSENESWWQDTFVGDAQRAIGQWNDAFVAFSANYSAYSYLSSVKVQSTVSNVSLPGYDLYINWTKTSLSNSSDEVGLAKTYVSGGSSIVNCTISLAVQTSQGTTMREIDIQNIAVHELGHGFGLGHCNYTGDVMYAIYSLGSPPKAVSTLDGYGVARCFSWLQNTSSFHPVSRWLNASYVTLPQTISYTDLPVSAQNQPPQTLADSPTIQFLLMMFTVLAQPIIAVPVLIVILVFVILAAIPRRKRRTSVMVGS
jgi:predicted Zn-dependent protease